MAPKKGDVAVFWDLEYVDPVDEPEATICRICQLGKRYGKVKYVNAYLGRPLLEGESAMVETLKLHGAEVHYCPKHGLGRKPTIHHTMEEDIAFHVTFDHRETKTVVFVTGDRDFDYCSQRLKSHGVMVVVLVKDHNGCIVESRAKEYWPVKVKKPGNAAPLKQVKEKKKSKSKKNKNKNKSRKK